MGEKCMKVLIAEDDLISRRLLEAILIKRGYDVVVACDDEEVWRVFQEKNAPRLAILDWMMPGIDGVDVCRRIRAKRDVPYVYIILLTAKNRKEDIAEGFDAGADDYVTKPFNARELCARVQVGVRMLDLQNSLEEYVERLKELGQLKSGFLSTVSSELRNSIAIMCERVSLCLDEVAGEVSETQRDLLTDVLENIDRLDRLVTNLLDVLKIEEGRIKVRRSSVDLCAIARKIRNGLEHSAAEKDITLRTYLPEEPLRLFVDEDKVTQIFHSLVFNAIRYTKAGGKITIDVEEKADVVECRVSINSSGIAKKDMPRLLSSFEQFGRAEGSGYRETSLGLVIAKELVEKHGGRIWVESELGKGTTFWFTLKKVPFPRILVVDDEKMVVDLVKKFLGEDGYQFLEAYEGKKAVEKAGSENPSLIVLDMLLPGMNGYEVIEQLKKNKGTRTIPVLILSAAPVDEERLDRCGDITEIRVMEKPIQQEELGRTVKELLSC